MDENNPTDYQHEQEKIPYPLADKCHRCTRTRDYCYVHGINFPGCFRPEPEVDAKYIEMQMERNEIAGKLKSVIAWYNKNCRSHVDMFEAMDFEFIFTGIEKRKSFDSVDEIKYDPDNLPIPETTERECIEKFGGLKFLVDQVKKCFEIRNDVHIGIDGSYDEAPFIFVDEWKLNLALLPLIGKNDNSGKREWGDRVVKISNGGELAIEDLQSYFDKHVREEPSKNWFHSMINMIALLLSMQGYKFDVFIDGIDYRAMIDRFDAYDEKKKNKKVLSFSIT